MAINKILILILPVHGSRDAQRPRGMAAVVPRGGSFFCIHHQSPGARSVHGGHGTAAVGTSRRAPPLRAQLQQPQLFLYSITLPGPPCPGRCARAV